uniref:Uncharacterized protein n=1 Tax=Anguilla anguilla TaxID=7936 RepID=A0A0E9U8G5_ANGAN
MEGPQNVVTSRSHLVLVCILSQDAHELEHTHNR